MKLRTFTRLVLAPAVVLVGLIVLAPTGAEAVPYSLHVTSANAVVTSSCDFSVTRYNQNNTGPSTVTARVTVKAAEVKPSFFAPRKVAFLNVYCDIFPASSPGNFVEVYKSNNGSTLYKTKYVTVPPDSGYQLCMLAGYVLKDGTEATTPTQCTPAV
jgi:hypothetical protein